MSSQARASGTWRRALASLTLCAVAVLALAACSDSPVIAINVLLEPGQVMLDRAADANARLRRHLPDGFAFDDTHRPHITLVQRYVRAGDLDAVYAAVGRVLSDVAPADWTLHATRLTYGRWGESGLAGIAVEPTDELRRLQQRLVAALEPFTVEGGTAAAFLRLAGEPDIDGPTIDYVAGFVRNQVGDRYSPHVTVGQGEIAVLDSMVAEPFDAFSFDVTGVAVYQLGNCGTARRQLRRWPAD